MSTNDKRSIRQELIRMELTKGHSSLFHIITLVRMIELAKYNQSMRIYSKLSGLYTR